ncbi:MAG: hypothetical protein PUK86_12080 [bacterium]|nr:hypothetical protein [bacterium]
MGRKYGSLHIRLESQGEDIDEVVSRCIIAMEAAFRVDVEKAAAQLGLNLNPQQLPLLSQLVNAGQSSRAKPKVVEHHGFVSIYDQRVTFENIQAIAQKLSGVLNLSVFFASVYDDDVFFFGLCEKGETVSEQIGGDCEAYGLRPESCHIEALESFLSNGEKTSPELNGLSGPELEAVLTEALGFRLNLE